MREYLKTISIVSGPNGAGKTTFVENFLRRYDRGLQNLVRIYLPLVVHA